MDNTSIESLRIIRSTSRDLLKYFNDSYIAKLEQVQSLKTEEFELNAKIEELQKTLDVYSFKTSVGHNVFSPFTANTTSQQDKAEQIELQLAELLDIQASLKKQISDRESEIDLLKTRISELSTSSRLLDELLDEVTEEVSTIDEPDTGNTDNHEDTDTAVDHGIHILQLLQYDKKQLAEKIQSDITEVLDANSHKLDILSWLMRSDLNRAKVTLEELTTSTSKLADYVDDLAMNLADEADSDEPVWTLLENLFQNYREEHTELNISYNIDCTDYAINIPGIVVTNLVYIIKELMTNIFTHSNANKVVVKIYISSRLIDVFINDNGVGIDSSRTDAVPWNSGLHKIKEIIYLLSGTFKIDGDIDSGTNVRFSFPLIQ